MSVFFVNRRLDVLVYEAVQIPDPGQLLSFNYSVFTGEFISTITSNNKQVLALGYEILLTKVGNCGFLKV